MGSTNHDDSWTWVISLRGETQFATVEAESQAQIIATLVEGVSSEWRESQNYLEPLSGAAFHTSLFEV